MSAVAPILEVTWEKLPDDFVLDDEPVDNIAQPILAAALTESLYVTGRLPATALTTTNYAICATVNRRIVVKAPDWSYVPALRVAREQVMRSYTPHLQGQNLLIVMEFLSDTDGSEYDNQPSWPYGKWFFYEQILQVPHYAIFHPGTGRLDVYRLNALGNYERRPADHQGRYWIGELGLLLGVWQGSRDDYTGYWLRWWDEHGQLLPWRSEVLEQQTRRLEQERQRVEQERQRAEQAQQRAEQERQRAEQEHQGAEQAQQWAKQEHQRAEQERQSAEQAQQRAEQEHQRAEQERQRAEQERQRAEQERQRAEQLEQARREAVSRLLAVGLNAEQVANALGLTVAEVRSAGT